MFCKNCGKNLGMDDKFCSECGTRVMVEKKKTEDLEPMFFLEKREEPEKEKKAKKVIHLDEFNWNLDGYPTAPKKTEDVDFNWSSVLEEKEGKAASAPAEPEPEEKEPLVETPETIEQLWETLPSDLLEMAEVPEEIPATERKTPEENLEKDAAAEAAVPKEEKKEDVKTLEQIIADFGETQIEEPTRLIDKAQMKADSVERFYVFRKKQEEYQNLLDQEYDRIQSSLQENADGEAPENLTVEEILETPEEGVLGIQEADFVTTEESAVGEDAEIPVAIPVATEKPLELVAIMWSMPPAGILIGEAEAQAEKMTTDTEETVQVEAPEKEAEKVPAATIVMERPEAEPAQSDAAEETAKPENTVNPEEKEPISFANIFDDEEDETKEGKGGGCLKAIAIVLFILFVAELGILGIQHFAEDSKAAAFINQTYENIVTMITGSETSSDEPAVAETSAAPSEIEMLIAALESKNENIEEIMENQELVFESGQDYGYEELSDTYAFKNSPWYEDDEGREITYGDEIIGTLIQYYSALPDRMNDVNKDVFDYVDDTTALYEELEAVEGDETMEYIIHRLEIGEIRTGQKGFYVMVNVTSTDKLQPEQKQQKQLVYLEANPNKQSIKIKETKNI